MTDATRASDSPDDVRLQVGARLAPRTLLTLSGTSLSIPDSSALVHLQLRRYAGCPICSLHLRALVQRKDELRAAGIREVAVFHSSAEDLRKVHAELPFDVVPDPARTLYDTLGVGTSVRAVLDPRAWLAAAHAVAVGASRDPHAGGADGSFGLPGDFLIASDGCLVAVKYGVHADDHWSVDEVIALAKGAAT
jgi:peroxiredoxin